MAEDRDDAQKTEEPTQRRLDEAREKGQVAVSREINHVFVLGAAALLLALLGPAVAGSIAATLKPLLAHPHAIPTDPDHLRRVVVELLTALGHALLLPLVLLLVAAAAGGLVQNAVLFSTDTLIPKLERISPLAGLKRLFSLRSLAEFAKGVLKLATVGAVGAAVLWPAWPGVIGAFELDAGSLLARARELALRLLVGIAVPVVLIALLDLAHQGHEHRKRLRMSRRELKEEFKQTEGDPMIMSRRRAPRQERAPPDDGRGAEGGRGRHQPDPRRRRAPLRPGDHGGARLVAKGTNTLALRIREVALAHDVPVVENPPLARTLHAAVDLDQEIPPAHYRAVAEIIGYVLRLRGPGAGPVPAPDSGSVNP